MKARKMGLLAWMVVVSWLAGCSPESQVHIHYDPASLRFSGEAALAKEAEFVMQFPYRHSGEPNNRLAAEWLYEQFSALGLSCKLDEWEVVNYSKPVKLQNVVCVLAGESEREILVSAHHDQSPDTIYGADNDGSGIAILLQLAEIFASEGKPRYTLVFLSTDGEEYGMLGARQYIETHPDTENIIAGFSMDNMGKTIYDNMEMAAIGQFRNFGSLWLQRLAQEAARAAGDLWVPAIRSPLDQVLNQAVPVSLMDQGPMIAAGVPALGFTGLVAKGYSEAHWETYHSPLDTLDTQSTEVLYQGGRIPEALLRELLSRDEFPEERGPYLYLQGRGETLRGLPLWLIFIGIVSLFFIGAYFKGGVNPKEKLGAWRVGLIHWLSIWLPLLGGVLLTYGLVAVGLMDEYHLYPATARDEPIYEPRWPAVIVFVVGMAVFLYAGRRMAQRAGTAEAQLTPGQTNSFGLLITGIGAAYILILNPFSLLFFVPVLAWLLIGGRRGWRKLLDVILLLTGGLVIYALIYFFGFVILRNGFVVFWYLLMMFSSKMISLPVAAAITAVLGAGLSMIVGPPRYKVRSE
ncbi:MAG: M28 family peptidase [Anaerolineae bacterium]|nr:M28 family peptidase [Anaerolineae bacterium]